nr:thiamine transporter membrane protein [Streptococcus thermophilus]
MAQPVTAAPAEEAIDPASDKKVRRRNQHKTSAASTAILIVAAIYFALPWFAAAIFGFTRPGVGFTTDTLMETFNHSRAGESLINTLLLTVVTHPGHADSPGAHHHLLNLKAPQMAKAAEFLSVLPLVVPAVALVNGVSVFFRPFAPGLLTSMWILVPLYVINALPLCYRAIDAGVKALDLRTMFAASSSLGATTWQTLSGVVIPNLRVAMLSASLLCIAMVVSEFAIGLFAPAVHLPCVHGRSLVDEPARYRRPVLLRHDLHLDSAQLDLGGIHHLAQKE